MTDEERLAGFIGTLEDVLTGLRDGRLETLDGLLERQTMGRILLQNEAVRMDRKLGEDHPRSRYLRVALEQNAEGIRDLGVELETSTILPPEVEEKQTLLHGRVVDEDGRGVPNLLVSLTDESGRILHSLGRSETDTSGYYALVIDPDALQKESEAVESGVLVTVDTSKDELVHRTFEPLKVSEGDRKLLDQVVLDRRDLIGERRQPEYRPRVVGREKPRAGTPTGRPQPSDDVDLERVRGIGPKRADQLRQAGIEDVQALLDADEEKLKEVLGNVDVQGLKREGAAVLEEMEGETGEAMASD
ncbi:MAG: helix-hairpin-helix domain-containing protein [Actinomycetota bacterium]